MWSQEKSFVPPPPSTAYNQPPPPPSNGHSKDKKRYDPLEDDDEDDFVPLPPRPPQHQQQQQHHHHQQYPQPPQQAQHTGSGIDFSKYDDIPVECSGRSPVSPISSWRDIDLTSTIQKNIDDAKYTKPTPVQRYSLPIVMNGRDLMSCAQTGSGKTAAFLLPVLVNLTKMRDYGNGNGGYGRKATPYVLVLAPTRELAIQIFDECKKFSNGTRIRACILYGGAPMGGQLRELERGCDVIIATPGRLTDVMDRGKVSLANIKYLILDEADRMLDMGFEPQIRRIVQKEDMPTTGKRQTLMFSATFPKEIQQLASQFLHDYLFLTIGRVGSTTELVSQKFVKVFDESDKQQKLLQLVATVPGLTLIFVETKKKANNLDYYLKRNGFPSSSIHGDREQAEREAALKSFSSGRTPYLIATNVAARGLDISGVVHVINYDMAPNIDDYVHRIGRTGRAGKAGVSTTFMTTDNANVVSELLKLLRDAKQEIPPWLEEMKYLRKSSGGYKGNSGGRFGSSFGGGGKKFGAKDFRQDFRQDNKPDRSSSSSSSNYPVPPYGGTPFGFAPLGFQPPFQGTPNSSNFPVPPFDPALMASYYGYPPNAFGQPPANNTTNNTTSSSSTSDQNGHSDDRSSKKRQYDDSRDRDRDSHRDRDRDSHRDRDSRRDKDSHRDREHRDRDSHSSRDRDRDGHRDRDSHHRDRDSRRDKDSHSSRDRDDRDRKHRKTDDEYRSSRDRSHY